MQTTAGTYEVVTVEKGVGTIGSGFWDVGNALFGSRACSPVV